MAKQNESLWGSLVSASNLFSAFDKAARGKRGKTTAASFVHGLKNISQMNTDVTRMDTDSPP